MLVLLLFLISLLPVVFFLRHIYVADRYEREPIRSVLLAFFLGAASCFPAIVIELLLDRIIPTAPGLVSAVLQSFIKIAPAEEASKLVFVLLFLYRTPNFNEENDGLVYTSAVALGFAGLENVFYVVSGGVSVGVARAITAIPLHYFTGIVMGYYIGLSKFNESKKWSLIAKGFLLAYFFHAIYDTFALSGTAAALLIVPCVVLLFFIGRRLEKKGAELSRDRWTGVVLPERALDVKRPSVIMVVASRFLIGGSCLFWVLALWGNSGSKHPVDVLSIVFGCIIITFLPLLLAILLEFLYAKRRRTYLARG